MRLQVVNFTLRVPSLCLQEIEISGTDTEGEVAAASDSGDDANSDSNETSIGKSRKRSTRSSDRGPKPKTSRKLREIRRSPAAGGKRQATNPTARPSQPSPDGSASSINRHKRTQEILPLLGALNVEGLSRLGVSNDGDNSGTDESVSDRPSLLSRLAGAGGPTKGTATPAPPKVDITTDIFDLKENAERRKHFQAGVQATSGEADSANNTQADGGRSVGKAGASRNGETDLGGPGLAHGSSVGASASVTAAADISMTTVGGRSNAAPFCGREKCQADSGARGRVKLTPMEQQVSNLKAQHPGVLLLVECGYRYRFFGDDALAAAKVNGGMITP